MDSIQKELIAIKVIETLYKQFCKFPGVDSQNRNAPFHEAFLNAFANDLQGRVQNIPTLISLSSWLHGLNTSLGQSFFEKTAHILSEGSKREFTEKKRTTLKITSLQREVLGEIISDLKSGRRKPNKVIEEEEISKSVTGEIVSATNFTVDVFIEDDHQIICIEIKTVKPNSSVFKAEKEKILEAKAALAKAFPNKKIQYLIGFPFDPQSDTPTGSDKARFWQYSVEFSKFFALDEFLLASEFWDFLSGEKQTMESILDIINAIATVDFWEKFRFLQERQNLTDNRAKYLSLLTEWSLQREIEIISYPSHKNKKFTQNFNKPPFSEDNSGCDFHIQRTSTLLELINSNN
jgi:hypothetical protein